MKKIFLLIILVFSLNGISIAQSRFQVETKIASTPIKDQGNFQSAWTYAVTSFLESEIIRNGYDPIDLSEDFLFRNYLELSAFRYIFQKENCVWDHKGSVSDYLYSVNRFGLMPENQFQSPDDEYFWDELTTGLKAYSDGIKTQEQMSDKWPAVIHNMINAYFGSNPESFQFGNIQYSPKSFIDSLGISVSHYTHLTSFAHHPYYENIKLESNPANSTANSINLPLTELLEIIDYAILEGFSLCWEGDSSEVGFTPIQGIAQLNEEMNLTDSTPLAELRLQHYLQLQTSHDQALHLIGIAFDITGQKFYILKNSLGKTGPYLGLIYMTEAYFKLKTRSITVHKDGIPKKSADKLLSYNK